MDKQICLHKGVAVLAAALAGCASAPPQNAQLVSAQQVFSTARSNPEVVTRAPQELAQANQALDAAKRSWEQRAEPAVVSHEAYLAEQRAHIALQTAELRAAEAAVAQADAQRNSVLLQARERQAREEKQRAEAQAREADQARQVAAQHEREAREQSEQARRAQQQAEQRREELQQAQQQVQQLQSQVKDLRAQETDRGWVLTLGTDVLFDSGHAVLKPGAQRSIDQLAAFLKTHPEQSIQVNGFTDSRGSEALNESLSQRRAQAVRDALVAQGIDASRILASGLGESYPVASNDTAAGRQLNRRVEIIVPRPNATAQREAPSASQGSSSNPAR